ncbi:MAG: nucleotidyltransferase domain-containing protein [Patescibacteria group bacterium]
MALDIQKIKPIVKKLAQKYGLFLVILFGSQATGKIHKKSDVDIAFYSDKKMSLYDIAKTQIEFEQALKVGKIELVDLRNAPPLLLKEIAKNSALLYERDVFAFSRFKIYAFKRYMESKKLLALRAAALDRFIKKT